jgi:teichuronic acid exporter
MGVAVYLGFFTAAPWIARLFEDPLYTDLIRVSALSFLAATLPGHAQCLAQPGNEFQESLHRGYRRGVRHGLSGTLMALAGMGVWSLTLSGLLTAFFKNAWLARLTPLRLNINMDFWNMRKHSSYGIQDHWQRLRDLSKNEAKTLIISKLAGPAFLGLFKKAESLSRLPNQLVMSATMDPVFRAMSKFRTTWTKPSTCSIAPSRC